MITHARIDTSPPSRELSTPSTSTSSFQVSLFPRVSPWSSYDQNRLEFSTTLPGLLLLQICLLLTKFAIPFRLVARRLLTYASHRLRNTVSTLQYLLSHMTLFSPFSQLARVRRRLLQEKSTSSVRSEYRSPSRYSGNRASSS